MTGDQILQGGGGEEILLPQAQLAPLARESADAEAWLALPDAYEETIRDRLQSTLKRRSELAGRISTLEDDWLWTQAEIEKELGKLK